MYLDILDQRVVTVPLRFDFDSGDAFIPVEHPKSHLTLGQYENCRIPVSSAVSPFQFMDFILRNFYHTAHTKFCERLTRYSDRFEKSILPEEEALGSPAYRERRTEPPQALHPHDLIPNPLSEPRHSLADDGTLL